MINIIDEEKKSQYWNHFTDEFHRRFRPKKITDMRLKEIKESVLDDDFLWQEVISRHNALDKTPNELKETSPPDYEQSRANFWAMIREKIHRQATQATV
ncbi:MAG: hypothetical protein LH614_10080 [Pyrinomonadaceae bacterium]|nr:hypothetical protein [Pyrinomonadaceae bacterium]